MPQKGLDPLQQGLPEPVRAVVEQLREVYTEGPFGRLREVEDAILAARRERPDLVTVSSATCSRMLGPRGGGGSRTALPRWPSVWSFLVVHGVDPEPFEARWAAARDAWAEGPPEEEPDAVSEAEPDRGVDGQRRLLPLAVAGLLLFAAGVGLGFWLGGPAGPESSTPAVVPLARPGAGPTGVSCDITGSGVRFRSVASDDGAPGIAARIRVELEVLRPAAPGYTYWLVLRPSTEGSPFSAGAPVPTGTGPASLVLTVDSPVGSVRDLVVVAADPGAEAWLRESGEHEGDSSGGALPPGADAVSGTCHVERTR